MSIKVCISGAHGTGKSKICERVKLKLYDNFFTQEKEKIHKDSNYGPTEIHYNFQNQFVLIPEQFREVVKDLNLPKDVTHFEQTEEITLATYAKQLYLENLYTEQGKNILCDRGILDTFIYYSFFNKVHFDDFEIPCWDLGGDYLIKTYTKIYLIEPSNREIEPDGFRLTDKKQQLEIHQLFLEYFKDLNNVEIVNQEEQDKIVEMVVNDFNV